MTLTHWDNVEWADSATDRPEHDGLTKRGEKLVREMNRLGMFVDISHVSADTMRDVLRVTRAPVIFSHSSALGVAGHPRNAPDDVLRALAANGGVVHVNFIGAFIAPDHAAWDAQRKAAKKELQAQGGRRRGPRQGGQAVGEGESRAAAARCRSSPTTSTTSSRWPGSTTSGSAPTSTTTATSSMVPGLENVTRYPYLFAELLRRGYSDEDVMKIAGRNHLRAMRQMEKRRGRAAEDGAAAHPRRAGRPSDALAKGVGRMNFLFKEEPTHYSYDDLVARREDELERREEPARPEAPALREEGRRDLLLPHRRREGGRRGREGRRRRLSRSRRTRAASSTRSTSCPVKKLARPVTLAEIKATAVFKDFPLVRISRLSVMPVSEKEWAEIEKMAAS